MVKYSNASLNATFSALSDPTRRAILSRLAQGEVTVSELARPFQMSLPAISKHLRILEGAGLVDRQVEGRLHRLRLLAEPMAAAAEWIERYRAFWEGRLDSLANYFKNLQNKEKDHGRDEPPTKPNRPRSPRKSLRRVDRG